MTASADDRESAAARSIAETEHRCLGSVVAGVCPVPPPTTSTHHDALMYACTMRTTLDLDDAVLVAARSIAETEHRSLGSVVSELARRGLVPAQRADDGFPTFQVSPDALPLTPEMVDRALDE